MPTHRAIHPLQPVALAGLAVALSLGAAVDGSAGPVVVCARPCEKTQTVSDRESIATWLSVLSHAARRAHGHNHAAALTQPQPLPATPTPSKPTSLSNTAQHQPSQLIPPRLTNLPPPQA